MLNCLKSHQIQVDYKIHIHRMQALKLRKCCLQKYSTTWRLVLGRTTIRLVRCYLMSAIFKQCHRFSMGIRSGLWRGRWKIFPYFILNTALLCPCDGTTLKMKKAQVLVVKSKRTMVPPLYFTQYWFNHAKKSSFLGHNLVYISILISRFFFSSLPHK